MKRKWVGSNIISYGDKERQHEWGFQDIWIKNFLILSVKFYGMWREDYGNIHDKIKRRNELMYEPAYLLGKHGVNGK